MRHRPLLTLALLCSASGAMAADIGPRIGYSVGRNLYLAAPDGTSIKLLYTAANRKSLFSVQLKPGGGEAAFEETACCSVPRSSVLKIVRYDASGTKTGTASITVCGRISDIAYHPTDGTLLYASSCDYALKRLNTATMASTSVPVPHQASKASWLPGGTQFIYAAAAKIWRVSAATPGSPTAVAYADCVQSLDSANAVNRALWTDACAGSVKLLDLSTGQSTTLRQGAIGRFSPSDLRYAYLTPLTGTGRYLLISNLDGSGTQIRIGAEANYSSVDWRK